MVSRASASPPFGGSFPFLPFLTPGFDADSVGVLHPGLRLRRPLSGALARQAIYGSPGDVSYEVHSGRGAWLRSTARRQHGCRTPYLHTDATGPATEYREERWKSVLFVFGLRISENECQGIIRSLSGLPLIFAGSVSERPDALLAIPRSIGRGTHSRR